MRSVSFQNSLPLRSLTHPTLFVFFFTEPISTRGIPHNILEDILRVPSVINMVYRSVQHTRCINAADCPYITMRRCPRRVPLFFARSAQSSPQPPASLDFSPSANFSLATVYSVSYGWWPRVLLKYWVTPRCIIYIAIFRACTRVYVRRSVRVRTRRRRSRGRVARGLEWSSSNFAGVGYAARYGHPFRAPKWTSSSLEGPFQKIAEDEQGEGGRCMGSCFHKEIWLSLRRQ